MEAVFRTDSYRRSCNATVLSVDERGIRLDRTVFYPMGGGQPGDSGFLTFGNRRIRITDALKGDDADDVIHVMENPDDAPQPGTALTAEIDWDRRYRHMRMHTCLHLLCAIVPGAVTGGQIGIDRSRLDFNVPAASLDRDEITASLNRLIERDLPVGCRWISAEELAACPELVRTMSVKPPVGTGSVRLLDIEGVDLQPCGGTHVGRTGEIGPVEVVRIENKGRQNRRVIVALKS